MEHDGSDHESLNISDVIEVIQTTDPAYVTATNMYGAGGVDDDSKRAAYVKIVEQPASKALRFRYECEGRSAGSIPGVNSTPENKTFPSIQIVGYKGRAVVVVSCVTKDEPHKAHPHNLVGKEGCKKGVCTMEMNNESMTMTFSNLGIQCVKKRDIEAALGVREDIRVDPYRTGFAHRSQPTSIDLNAVRLCFQVFLEGVRGKGFTFQLAPVVSDPIYDKKAMSDLVICKLSDCTSSVAGGREIILLCEKVAKEDIQVRFYEERNGQVTWEGYGDFQPTQVHKQVAISFRSPSYSSLDVDAPVQVHIQLKRPSDGALSEPLPFELLPLDSGRAAFWSLRKGRVLANKADYSTFSSILTSSRAMLAMPAPATVEIVETVESAVVAAPTDLGPVGDSGRVDDVEPVSGLEPAGEGGEAAWTALEQAMVMGGNAEPGDDASRDDAETCRSLNELLSQVAELDVIYSDTKARLAEAHTPETQALETQALETQALETQALETQTPETQLEPEEMMIDENTYSSMQLAMKNPLLLSNGSNGWNGSKREMTDGTDGKLPPLPPKRIKKSPPAIPTRPVHVRAASETNLAPEKSLPPLPPAESAGKPAKAHSKPNIFQKLFSKRPAKSAKKAASDADSVHSVRKGSLDSLILVRGEESRSEEADARAESRDDGCVGSTANFDGEERTEMELTEAEHFALYTDLAPQATGSEFDEMSFYYSPVEGGKIVASNESAVKKDLVA